ncbi:hypothetical protein CMUS01_06537 [Colletotrichum musicola]|uniref:HNH nuclease domain-containing protein n=1 Tax=Colletotrichum musicola TaxID=2175873 RepID=A0A8H6KLL2_9PEZI|nr:hypothetical protein CMUS01_06537 [Colletotrichum musicola]
MLDTTQAQKYFSNFNMNARRTSDGPASYLPQNDIARRQELILQIHTLSETSNQDSGVRDTNRQANLWGLLHTLDVTVLGNILEQTEEDYENPDMYRDDPAVSRKPNQTYTKTERPRTRQDGHKCIITGWYTTGVGHIFPHHARMRMSEVRDAVRRMDLVWSDKRQDALLGKLSKQVIDSVSNMLCMDRPAHWLWSEGFFALEPLDDNIDYEVEAPPASSSSDSEGDVEMAGTTRRTKKVYGLRLRFHWLPRTTLTSPDGPADFSADPRRMGKPLDHPEIYLLDANGLPASTGRIIEIYSEDEGALPDRDLIRLHWDMLRVTCAGGRS